MPVPFLPLPAGNPWGLGTEPVPAQVPAGVKGTVGGNRAVQAPDGSIQVEGIGVGVNAGKPDGQWWPYTADGLYPAPTDASPWVGDQNAGSAPAEQNPALTPPPAPPTSAAEATAAGAPSAAPTQVVRPSLSIRQVSDSSWLVREIDAAGHVLEQTWTRVEHAVQHAIRWGRQHV